MVLNFFELYDTVVFCAQMLFSFCNSMAGHSSIKANCFETCDWRYRKL